ncbi:MAG: GerMN domain-containing protein [Syntrophomonadaceae bacterium]|nr:GerMN domain-containing protein [Syntrophomonadaceae bacterium]
MHLSNEFKTNFRGGVNIGMLNIYSIVNSLCQIEGIDKVFFILLDATPDPLVHLGLIQPVTPNPGLVKR